MEFPGNLKYTKDHEWVSSQTGIIKVGVSSYAVEQLGDIVHVDLCEIGKSFKQGESFGTIESTKTVSDLYMPVAGKVVELNKAILSSPEKLQEDPYQEGWLLKLEVTENSTQPLMDAKQYETYVKEDE